MGPSASQLSKYPISIHALREEGDGSSHNKDVPFKGFLSTPSARRATCKPVTLPPEQVISIHALREEGDQASP